MAPSDKDPKPQLSERERKLAEALRSNLRRRKAGAGGGAEKTDSAKSGEKG